MSKSIIRLSKSCIGNDEKRAVQRVLEREFLGMGEEVQQFEKNLQAYLGRPTVCVVNGTAAIQLALQAIGVGMGDEVLVQSLTYVATFQAIKATGATPIACDIDPSTLTIDCHDAERRINENTKAIIPVHYAGGVGDLEKIYSLAKKHKLRVVEDAAHAFASRYKSKLIGGFGDIACFSFDGIKNITSGEGGCVASGDPTVIDKCKDSRLLGVIRDSDKRFAGSRSWEFDVTSQGWRYHMSNIMAAIGIEQLKKVDILAKRRQRLARTYCSQFSNVKGLEVLDLDYNEVVPHIFPIMLSTPVLRNEVRDACIDADIEVGIHYKPNHELSYFQTNNNLILRNTDLISGRLLTLPLHPDLSTADVIQISKLVKNILN